MPASFGVNLRVTGHCSRGGRKYMEDFFSVAYQESENEKDLEYAFIGIYDGHGGSEAAKFARKHLINLIVSQKLFWSDDDDDILRAIRQGYIATHYAMWREHDKWPKTAAGLPSTAGTTASVAFIRHGKIYIGHAGDSGIVLGYTENEDDTHWQAMPLTKEHKPECNVERSRIMNAGGKVITRSGVPRVVWNRPRIGHKGPVRRSTPIDEIPFLAVARSLGDLWSFNSALNQFVVSPIPDVRVVKINPKKFRCLVFGTDGLWNVMSANSAVEIVSYAEQMNEQNTCTGENRDWTNPSKCLVDKALEQWSKTRMRADNTSVVIIMIDPPGPPKREVLKSSTQQLIVENDRAVDAENDIQAATVMSAPDKRNFTMFDHSTKETVDLNTPMPTSGLAIMTRYDELPIAEQPLYATSDDDSGEDTSDLTSIPAAYAFANSSSNTDISYLASFAETYHQHSMGASTTIDVNPIDSAYMYHQLPHPMTEHQPSVLHHDVIDEPYSLTRLETRTEHYQSTYDESTSTSLTFTEMQQQQQLIQQQQQMYVGDQHQYDSISSSFLSQSCGLMQNPLDDSVQAALLIACEDSSVGPNKIADVVVVPPVVATEPGEEPTTDYLELYPDPDEMHDYSSSSPSSSENDIDIIAPPTPAAPEECVATVNEEPSLENQSFPVDATLLDIPAECKTADVSGILNADRDESTIQIHEISSSSKENDNESASYVKCTPPQLRSTKASMQRMTRSKQRPLDALKISRSTKRAARKVPPNNRCSSSSSSSSVVIKAIASRAKQIQNENMSTSNVNRVGLRRTCLASSAADGEAATTSATGPTGDRNKRTLRSKNLMAVKQMNPSVAVVSTTSASLPRHPAVVATTTPMMMSTRTSSSVAGRLAKQQNCVSTSVLLPSRQLRGVRDKPIDLVVAHKPKSMGRGVAAGGIRKLVLATGKSAVTPFSRSVTTRNRLQKSLGR